VHNISDTPTLPPSPIFSTARHHRIDHFPAATAHGIFGVVNWSPDPTKAEATARQNLRSMDQNMRNHWESKHLDKHMWQWVKTLVPLVNIKIAGKWMFIPLKMVCIGIDP